jgi:hypothetical protein
VTINENVVIVNENVDSIIEQLNNHENKKQSNKQKNILRKN